MADEFLDPRDVAEQRRLNEELGRVNADLAARARDAARAQEQLDTRQQATEERAAQREARKRQRRTVSRAATEGETAAEGRAGRATRERAASEERAGRALAVRARAEREVAAAVRQRPALGPGPTYPALPPGAPPALPAGGGGRGALPPGPPGPLLLPPGEDGDGRARRLRTNFEQAASATRGLSAEEERLLRISQGVARYETSFGGALAYQTRALGLSSNALTRHGYLTSEFIEAAARGEVSIRSLGQQVGGTIAKFAGWTAAAGAVYGAVAALGAVGRGAIDAASGVDLVARVIPAAADNADHLEGAFIRLSHQFNLPINDVTQAVYGMGKVFQDLPSALSASEQALFAVKVGELGAADATRYLTAIQQGFGASAAELPAIFDAINQAQNRFGGNTGQMIAGVAKAAGAFRLAGGDYRELIAIIEAGVKLTGVSGENVGTAVARSASVVLTKAGQDRLRAAGLDPRQSYTDLLGQAFQQAQGQPRERVEEIARALVPAGGQFARVFVPLLENKKLYQRILREVAPDRSRGSAERELGRALQQPNEQIAALGNNLEQLGAQLARIGGLDLFGGILVALNSALHLATDLLGLFRLVPEPLRDALLVLLQIGGVLKLLRRFDVGDRLPVGGFRDALRQPPGVRERTQILQGIRDEQRFLEETRRSTGQRAGLASYQVERQEERVRGLERAGAPVQERIGAARDLERRAEIARQLADDEDDLRRRIANIDEQKNRFQEATAGRAGRDLEHVRRSAQTAGIPFTLPTTDRPVAERPIPIGEDVPQFGGSGVGADANDQLRRESAERGRLARYFSDYHESLREGGLTERGLSRVIDGATGAAHTSGQVLRGLAGSTRGFASELAGSLGPLDAILLGFIVLDQAYQAQKAGLEKAQETFASAQRSGDPASFRRASDKARGQQGPLDFVQKLAYQFPGFSTLGSGLSLLGVEPPGSSLDKLAGASDQDARSLQRLQKLGLDLTLRQIAQRRQRGQATARNDREERAALEQAIRETRQSYGATGLFIDDPKARRQARVAAGARLRDYRAMLADLDAARGDVASALQKIKDPQGLAIFVGRLQTRTGLYGTNRRDIGQAAGAVARGYELAAGDPANAEKYLQQIKGAQSAVLDSENERLNRLLQLARTPAEAGRYRRQILRNFRQVRIGGIDDEIGRLQSDRAARAQREQQLQSDAQDAERQARGLGGAAFGGVPTLGGLQGGGDRRALEDARQKAEQKTSELRKLRQKDTEDSKRLQGLQRARRQAVEEYRLLAREQARQQFELRQQTYQSGTELLQSRTADPVAQARVAAGRLRTSVTSVREAYRKGLVSLADVRQAIAQANQAMQQLAQSRLEDFQGSQQLAASRYALSVGGDQEQTLRYAVSQAQQLVGFVGTQGKRLPPGAQRDALRSLADAQLALQQYLRDQAKALADARTELALARAGDNPVAQAQIQLDAARRHLGEARNPAERVQARADIVSRTRELRQARQQDAFDQIEYLADIGRIEHDVELQRLQDLLKTVKGNRQLRREIQRRIAALKNDLQDSGQFDLDVGNIRLPTAYEIRRAVVGGISPQMQVTNAPNVSVLVTDPQAALKVGEVLDQHLGTSTRSAMRAAGYRGG